jgi:hypothetical protein
MPTRNLGSKKRGKGPRAAKSHDSPASKKPAPSTIDLPTHHMVVDFRTASYLLAKAMRSGDSAKLLDGLVAFGREHPNLYVTVPSGLAVAFLGCTATSGTCSASIAQADIAILAGAPYISFTYTRTDGVGCECRDIDDVTITTASGSTLKLSRGTLAELERINIPATTPAAKRWSGKVSGAGATGATISAGDAITITASFKCHATKYCHTCTPDPTTATAMVTVK